MFWPRLLSKGQVPRQTGSLVKELGEGLWADGNPFSPASGQEWLWEALLGLLHSPAGCGEGEGAWGGPGYGYGEGEGEGGWQQVPSLPCTFSPRA